MSSAPAQLVPPEIQIRRILDEAAAAIASRDIAAAVAQFAPEVFQYDVVGPLESRGVAACEERTREWFGAFSGPIEFERRHVHIAAADDVAFAHCLNHVTATQIHGAKLDMWWRSTTGFRRCKGRWLIVHEHNSIPFNPQTGQASLDLKG
ncbi:MAG: nuclear transport factor 2 family protein [Candidatus Acidiferrales bacterium]